jgi:hypothetical protein
VDLATHTSLSPIRLGFAPCFVSYKKGCTRLTAASDKVYQLLAHGRWFSPGTPASSTTKTGRRDIAEILLKVALKHQKSEINHLMGVFNTLYSATYLFQYITKDVIVRCFNSALFLYYYYYILFFYLVNFV